MEFEEACALSGRKGVKISPGADVSDDDVDVNMFISNGEITNADVNVGDSVDFHDPMPDVSTHVATPELSHPGEDLEVPSMAIWCHFEVALLGAIWCHW